MKKIITISILALMLILTLATGVNAVTNDNLAQTLYNIGAKYGMTASDKVKIDRYLADNPVTEAEANSIVAKANEATNVMKQAGVTKYSELSTEQKAQVKAKINEAASVAGVTVVFKTNALDVYKDGKLIESVTNNNGKLAYTGNNNIILVVSSIAVIALATIAIARKKLANA